MNEGIETQNIQFNTKTEYYAEDLNESKVQSVVSRASNPQNLLSFFKDYTVKSTQFNMATLHASPALKLKKYKESVYYGEYVNGKRHGKGVMVYDNSRVY